MAKPSDTTVEEAERLTKLFERVKNRAQFARDYNIPGGAAGIYQHITGHRPISLDAAIAYADGLKVSLQEVSPRWAELVVRASRYLSENPVVHEDPRPSAPSNEWPFKTVSYEEYASLSDEKKQQLEDRMSAFIAGASPVSNRRKTANA